MGFFWSFMDSFAWKRTKMEGKNTNAVLKSHIGVLVVWSTHDSMNLNECLNG